MHFLLQTPSPSCPIAVTPGRAVTGSFVRALQSVLWLCILCTTEAATQTGAAPSVHLPTCRSVERENLGRNHTQDVFLQLFIVLWFSLREGLRESSSRWQLGRGQKHFILWIWDFQNFDLTVAVKEHKEILKKKKKNISCGIARSFFIACSEGKQLQETSVSSEAVEL